MQKDTLKIFIIAGEMSGDILGARLIKRLRDKGISLEIAGVGGPKMQEEGLNSIFPVKEIALFGYFEIIPHILKIKRLIKKTIDQAKKFQPDIVVTIDSPGFNFRVIKVLADLECKKVHYVAPSIWIKPERVRFLEKYYDKVLALLPFETKYFAASDLECEFVGHPIIEENFADIDAGSFRKKHNISDEQVLSVVMTGSRKSEYTKLTPVFLDALELMAKKIGRKIVAAMPFVSSEHKKYLSRYALSSDRVDILLVPEEEKKSLYSAADIALVKSGTSSLEISAAGLPIVVGYKVSAISAWVARNILKFKGFVSIINILANKEIIPELIQENCQASIISEKLVELFDKKASAKQISEARCEVTKLKPFGGVMPSEAAAEAVLTLIEKNKNL